MSILEFHAFILIKFNLSVLVYESSILHLIKDIFTYLKNTDFPPLFLLGVFLFLILGNRNHFGLSVEYSVGMDQCSLP